MLLALAPESIISITTTRPYRCSVKAAIDNQKQMGMTVLIKLYLQNPEEHWIYPFVGGFMIYIIGSQTG